MVRLVDWEEGNYRTSENPPRGEIVIGGGNVATGYYKLPEKTREDFHTDAEGRRWFKTGDIGEMAPDGTLRYALPLTQLYSFRFFLNHGVINLKKCTLSVWK